MSWTNGSHIFSEIAELMLETISDDLQRKIIYMGLIEIFDAADCVNLSECIDIDPALDSALEEMEIVSFQECEEEIDLED
jgi:hypothetical protein